MIKDIKPASKYHFLVIPRKHIRDAKSLTKDDKQLCKYSIPIGLVVCASFDMEFIIPVLHFLVLNMIERAKISLQEQEDVDMSDAR